MNKLLESHCKFKLDILFGVYYFGLVEEVITCVVVVVFLKDK